MTWWLTPETWVRKNRTLLKTEKFRKLPETFRDLVCMSPCSVLPHSCHVVFVTGNCEKTKPKQPQELDCCFGEGFQLVTVKKYEDPARRRTKDVLWLGACDEHPSIVLQHLPKNGGVRIIVWLKKWWIILSVAPDLKYGCACLLRRIRRTQNYSKDWTLIKHSLSIFISARSWVLWTCWIRRVLPSGVDTQHQ